MNIKINTICFILLLFLLIGVASATDSDNETSIHSIEQPDNEIYQASLDNQDSPGTNIEYGKKLELSSTDKSELESSVKKPKLNVIIKAPDKSIYYKDGSLFTVTLKDQNKAVMKNVQVKIKVDGKTYTKKTDSKGKASISLSLKSGKYTVVTIFDETATHKKQTVKSTVTVKSTIKCDELTKYYKKNVDFYIKFYDKNGAPLKKSYVQFKLKNKYYNDITDSSGRVKVSFNLKPGKYSISIMNLKTSEKITKTVTIKSLIETNDLTMDEKDGSKFSVKVLNSNGNPSVGKKVFLTLNGKIYELTSDINGIASKTISLEAGKYVVTTEYGDLKNKNTITVNPAPPEDPVKKTEFVHTTIIPNYVNVTVPYAFHNSAYTLKTGTNGTIKMPKVEIFTIEIGQKVYSFATGKTERDDVMTLGFESNLVRMNGLGIVCSNTINVLKESGIIITRTATGTQIDYRDYTSDNIELFGFYADKNAENSETFTYMKNDKVMAKVTAQTQYYDETGVKYSLAKLYNRINLDFNYYEITNHVSNPVVFTNTGKPVTYSYFTSYIAGYPTREDIVTRFSVNGREEFEKTEQISYGRAYKYRSALGFEVLQSYSIINKKVTQNIMEDWVNKNSDYLSRFGAMNIYGMHLASLETAWLADEIADNYAKEFNVDWNRENTVTILGGINLDDTYLHILNADMGMEVNGNSANVELFRLINSMNLPNIESYALTPVADRFWDNAANSLDNMFASAGNYSIAQLGEMLYVFGENDSAIALNTTSGVVNVLLAHDNAVYKGSAIPTTKDCCSVNIIPQDIIKNLKNLFKIAAPGLYLLSNHFNNLHPLSTMAYNIGKFLLSSALTGVSAAANTLLSTMVFAQATGSAYRDMMVDQKDWHSVMDKITFTRPGYLQSKKIYNIPNKNGGTDYIEVKINNDLTLDRTSAKYISNGNTRQLTKQETYQYFCEDYWTPFSMPTKYWDESWKGK